jgi:polyphosphate kinase 2 (PPK2 family)
MMAEAKDDALETAGKLKRKDYERELARLHVEFVKLQRWVVHKGLRVCIVFEGRDGAGKGGTIKAITERVSPRIFRVVALPAPTEREKSQVYAQRYIPHLPAAGEVVIFDRSWYNRAGVERVMGFCTVEQAKRFLQDYVLKCQWAQASHVTMFSALTDGCPSLKQVITSTPSWV